MVSIVTSGTRQLKLQRRGNWQCYCLCATALLSTGVFSCVQLNNTPTWDNNKWYQMYYGAFLVAIIALAIAVVSYRLQKAEKEGREDDANKLIILFTGLLGLKFIGLCIGSTFLGVFIKNSGVFHSCSNITMTSAMDTSCLANNKGSTAICVLFFCICFFVLLLSVGDRLCGYHQCTRHNKIIVETEIIVEPTSDNEANIALPEGDEVELVQLRHPAH